MAVYRVEVSAVRGPDSEGSVVAAALRETGLTDVARVRLSRLFFLEGALDTADAQAIADGLLVDPVTERATVVGESDPLPDPGDGASAVEIHPRPGVMDPVAESTLAEVRAAGFAVEAVRTARRYEVVTQAPSDQVRRAVERALANDCIEEAVLGTAGVRPGPRPPVADNRLRHVFLTGRTDAELETLAREAHLFLSIAEMRAIQAHFRALGREPTDLELETIAQTWSEHCVHKTLKSAVTYRGEPLPGSGVVGLETRRYGNLLRDTIARATAELIAAGRGPQCLSVFKDNAGVIGLDEETALAFKVETHNHPSAIEPYGGAATGIGGVIRDVIGCGLGARPIANTDVFCVAPADWPQDPLSRGVLHPWRVLRGVVKGVADYGNRMGIPTVSGAVVFDPRYLGNPLVFCGCVGLMPRSAIEKGARPGDRIVLIGGRTGRDGIHGATFSSAELTDTHADEFSHAVQIGNAITQRRFLEAVLQARDAAGGCLYTAITDCGAGGLSSAVGEMGAEIGAVVELADVPLKYAGLRYDEIWISEAQERMVLAVPPDNLERFLAIMAAEEVEATVIGTFGPPPDVPPGAPPELVVRFRGQTVGRLDMRFLHDGLPRVERVAEWYAPVVTPAPAPATAGPEALERLCDELRRANIASKEWIIRQYDHEVQGGSVIKPLCGPGRGPADAAVLRPRLDAARGIALGCGLAPHLADVDPYWMAAAAIDEAVRNVVCVGGDPGRTAILDNFCWGRTDDPQQLGALVRACQACYDFAVVYGTPFISGKDSLNNEFALDAADVEPLIAVLTARAARTDADAARLRAILPALAARLRTRRRLAVPPTLLISALSLIDDVAGCLTPDLKRPGDAVLLIGGLPPTGFAAAAAAAVHAAVAGLIRTRRVNACHDVADGGWLVSVAEMALAGTRGVQLAPGSAPDPLAELAAGYVVTTPDPAPILAELGSAGVQGTTLGTVSEDPAVAWGGRRVPVADLAAAWSRGPH